jgi:cell division transport system ATP-binding protein
VIDVKNLGFRYRRGQALFSNLNLQLPAGTLCGLLGANGAGKSTLLKLLGLIERPSRGDITVNGTPLARVRAGSVPYVRRDIGMVFQNHRLLMDRNVFDNVALPLRITGAGRDEIARRVRAALDKVGLLEREKSLPATLSTGEQQRVGIARAIVGKPPLIIADEPTGNLDPQLSVEIMRLFAEFEQVGTTVLVASHDLHLIRHMGKRVLVLDHGRLIDDFRPATP